MGIPSGRMGLTMGSLRGQVVVFLVALALAAACPNSAVAQNAPLDLGTWKLNPAKSTYRPGPPPLSQTDTYEAVGDAEKRTIEIVSANGTSTIQIYTAKFDGKDYPRTGSANSDSTALKRIDAHTVDGTVKKAGKVVMTWREVISDDGKVMTFTVAGTDVKGQSIHNLLVFDKQ